MLCISCHVMSKSTADLDVLLQLSGLRWWQPDPVFMTFPDLQPASSIHSDSMVRPAYAISYHLSLIKWFNWWSLTDSITPPGNSKGLFFYNFFITYNFYVSTLKKLRSDNFPGQVSTHGIYILFSKYHFPLKEFRALWRSGWFLVQKMA